MKTSKKKKGFGEITKKTTMGTTNGVLFAVMFCIFYI